MKIVGNTTSQEECEQIEDIVKTFLVAQRARNLATKHHKPSYPKKTLFHTLTKPPPHPQENHHFTVKGLT